MESAESGVGNQLFAEPKRIVRASSLHLCASTDRRCGWWPEHMIGMSVSKASAIRRSTPQVWHFAMISDASPDAPNSLRLNDAGLHGNLPLWTKLTHGKSVRCPS